MISMDKYLDHIVDDALVHGYRPLPGRSLSFSAAYFTTKVIVMIAMFEMETGYRFPLEKVPADLLGVKKALEDL